MCERNQDNQKVLKAKDVEAGEKIRKGNQLKKLVEPGNRQKYEKARTTEKQAEKFLRWHRISLIFANNQINFEFYFHPLQVSENFFRGA